MTAAWSAPTPPAALLYGGEGASQTTSDLFTIDPATVVLSSIGAAGVAFTGLAFRPSDGVLFGSTSNNSTVNKQSLVTVDTSTGAATLVGNFGIFQTLGDIAFLSNDSLFGYNAGNRRLYSVNTTTGVATQVSATQIPTSGQGYGCSVDSSDNFYVFPKGTSGVFYLVDVTTGGLTAQPSLSGSPFGGSVNAASFDSTDVCYISISDGFINWDLATVDIATGVITDIGPTAGGEKLDAIAWSAA